MYCVITIILFDINDVKNYNNQYSYRLILLTTIIVQFK